MFVYTEDMQKSVTTVLFKTANQMLHEEKFAEAVIYYRKVIKQDPTHLKAYSNLGVALKQLQHFSEAIAVFEQVLKQSPQTAEIHNNLGNVYTAQGEFKKAINSYKKALAIKSHYKDALLNLGAVYFFTGQEKKAMDILVVVEQMSDSKKKKFI